MQQPTIGHNQPPAPLTPAEVKAYLDDAFAALSDRRDCIITALAASAKAYQRIDDDSAFGLVAENVKMASNLEGTAEKHREKEKSPFWQGGKAVDSWFRAFLHPLKEALDPVQTAMDDYGARKLAAMRARIDAERAEAEAEARRTAEAAMAASARDRPTQARAWDKAETAAKALEQATQASQAGAADLTRAHGIYGAVASVRSTWTYDVTDFAAIPRQYLIIDHDAIKAAAKDRDPSGKPITKIPGITWREQTKVGVR